MTVNVFKRALALLAVVLTFAFLISLRTSANAYSAAQTTAVQATATEPQDQQALWAAVIKNLHERQTAPTQEKTAEQEYKNLQVLKSLPAAQLEDVMHLFNGSLGVGWWFLFRLHCGRTE